MRPKQAQAAVQIFMMRLCFDMKIQAKPKSSKKFFALYACIQQWQKIAMLMGIVDGSIAGGTPTFSFPQVAKHGWLCQGYYMQSCSLPSCPNNSAAQGKYFYDAVSATGDTALTVTGVQQCQGAEGVAQGLDPDTGLGGAAAVELDMQNKCR